MIFMEVTEFTPEGERKRTLSAAEVQQRADMGDFTAKRELLRASWASMTATQKIEAIKDLLGV